MMILQSHLFLKVSCKLRQIINLRKLKKVKFIKSIVIPDECPPPYDCCGAGAMTFIILITCPIRLLSLINYVSCKQRLKLALSRLVFFTQLEVNLVYFTRLDVDFIFLSRLEVE